jgi:hypothetical protein
LGVAGGQHEVAVLDLDSYAPRLTEEFVRAVRAWNVAEQLCLVGVASKVSTQRHFLRAGGDVTVETGSEQQLRAVVRWLIGAADTRPKGAQFRS